jgi:DMSO/TMAO reductase YedYZ molybdopterin-dependent catalytic subunit
VIHASYKWRSEWGGSGGRPGLTRRLFLVSTVAPALWAQKPEISSFDLSLLDQAATPNDLFFVREHFPTPSVTSAGWMLTVGGAVAEPLRIPFDDLAARPRKSLGVTLECAANPVAGGLVSHAEWAGVSLASVLQAARPGAKAGAVRLAGADGFAREIPLAKATSPDSMLALAMNGEKLPISHGFPVRAIIPGWYGTDSVKWLRSIDVLEGEPPAQEYEREVSSLLLGRRRAGAVTAMNVKSTFSRPLDGAILFGRRFTMRGAAWAGENRVRRVEVSLDGGASWQTAPLDSEPKPYAWVCWSYEWKIGAPGSYDLLVTATDDRGREQPAARPSDRVDEYEQNHRQSIQVTVR